MDTKCQIKIGGELYFLRTLNGIAYIEFYLLQGSVFDSLDEFNLISNKSGLLVAKGDEWDTIYIANGSTTPKELDALLKDSATFEEQLAAAHAKKHTPNLDATIDNSPANREYQPPEVKRAKT